MTNQTESPPPPPTASQIEDLRLAASRLRGPARRAFQAEMALKYCEGNSRRAERLFGWGRQTVALGLAEKHHQMVCVGSQSGFAGNQRWEERYPDAAATLIAYTRLTAPEARRQLQAQGVAEEQLPARSTMAVILNRLGYRLRPVVKAKPQKNSLRPT